MNTLPKISCIIPFYNTQKFLQDCIQSCIDQTYKNLEIILVNDGSTDASLQIAQSYLQYPQVVLIDLKTNRGASAARNIAIDFCLNTFKPQETIKIYGGGGNLSSKSRSEFLTFLDSDDLFTTTAIEKMFSCYRETQADIVSGHSIRIYEDGRIMRCKKPQKFPSGAMRTVDYLSCVRTQYFVFNATNCLIQSAIFEQLRYPEGVINEDMEFGFELMLKAKTIAKCNAATYHNRLRYGSISHPSSFLLGHCDELFYKTYRSQLHYLEKLKSQYANASFYPLILRTLRASASGAVVNLIQKNPEDKQRLQVFLPYASYKARLCFYFPRLYRILRAWWYNFRHSV